MTTARSKFIERHAPLACGLAFALPVLVVKFPPMADLPLHEASVGLLRHWGDARFAPPSLYFINIGHANQLFSLVVLALSYIFSVAWATKLGVALVLVALPLGAARFADHMCAPRWTALLIAPLGFGWLFFFGLINNIFGLAALLYFLPAIDKFALRPTRRGAIAMCGVALFLHFTHEAMELVACGALVVCSAGTPRRRESIALVWTVIFCFVAITCVAYRYAWHFTNHSFINVPLFRFHPLDHKLIAIPGVLFGGFEPYVRNLMLLLEAAPMMVFGIERFKQRRLPGHTRVFEQVYRWRFEFISLGLFAIYLLAPASVKTTTLVYHRFLPPAWAIAVVCVAANTRSVARVMPRVLCAILPLASIVIALPAFADSHQLYSDFDFILDHMAPGSAVIAIGYSPNHNYRLWQPHVVEGYAVAEHGGRSMFDYTQSPTSIVAQRPAKQWEDATVRLVGHGLDLRPQWDLRRFRYVIFDTQSPWFAAAVIIALGNEARLIASRGEWYLFESVLTVVPIDSDDVPLPTPAPPTLRELLSKTVGDLQMPAPVD